MSSLMVVESKWAQNPVTIQEVEGKQVIVDKRGKPKFYTDGSPVSVNGSTQCIAKSHTTGYRCQRYSVAGFRVCQKHGAGSPFKGRPGGRPSTSIFRHIKQLKPGLAERYEDAISDPTLLSMSNEIALIDTRISMLLEKLPDFDQYSHNIDTLLKGVQQIKTAFLSRDVDTLMEAIPLLLESTDTISSDRAGWSELMDLAQGRGKLVSREIEHRKIMKYYITAEEAANIVQSVVGVVNSVVKDQQTKNIIAAELKRLFDARNGKSINLNQKADNAEE